MTDSRFNNWVEPKVPGWKEKRREESIGSNGYIRIHSYGTIDGKEAVLSWYKKVGGEPVFAQLEEKIK